MSSQCASLSEPKRSQWPNDSECLQQPYADRENDNDMNDTFDRRINWQKGLYHVEKHSNDH
jgi:hypothetical protein